MSQFDAFGGGTSAEFYRRAREAAQQQARRGLYNPRQQDEARRYRETAATGTPHNSDQFTLLSSSDPRDAKLADRGSTEGLVTSEAALRARFESFRDAALDSLIDASMARDGEHYLRDRSPEGVSFAQRSGRFVARVEIAGLVFEGEGPIRSEALRELSSAVAGGVERAVETVRRTQHAVLDVTGMGGALENAAKHFRSRQYNLSQYGDRVPAALLRISDTDRHHAEMLGAVLSEHSNIRSLLASRQVRSSVRLSIAEDVSQRNPSESMEENDERMQRIELRRTDRYGPSR
jgi:hypothetical protein